jgi:hypothetical protein
MSCATRRQSVATSSITRSLPPQDPLGRRPEERKRNRDNRLGRGSRDSHDAIRRHIIGRAHALHIDEAIPDDWGPDGRLERA